MAEVPARIPNLSLIVPMRAVTPLKLTCFYVSRQERISRVFVPLNIILANVKSLIILRLKENDHKDLTDAPLRQDGQLVQNTGEFGLMSHSPSRKF